MPNGEEWSEVTFIGYEDMIAVQVAQGRTTLQGLQEELDGGYISLDAYTRFVSIIEAAALELMKVQKCDWCVTYITTHDTLKTVTIRQETKDTIGAVLTKKKGVKKYLVVTKDTSTQEE